MNYKILILTLLLTSCAADMTTPQATPPDVAALQSELLSANQKVIDAQNIVDAKQADIDRMERQRLEFTVTAEFLKSVEADRTQSAYSQQQAGTQLAIISTATAYPTAAELQRQAVALRNTELTAQAEAPDLLIKNIDAQAYAEYWEYREIGKLSAIGIFCLMLFSAFVYFVIYSVYRVQLIENMKKEKQAEAEAEEKKEKEFVPIPMAQNKDNPNQTLRAEIYCTNEQLFAVADGIINNEMSLAYGQWQDDKVVTRAALSVIRHALENHKITKPLRDGEVDVKTVECETFMRYVIEHGTPPPPFTCVLSKLPPPPA